MRFLAELRARWRTWLTLAVLAGVAGGLVVAAAAGARRTDSALARHLVAYRFPDATLSAEDVGDDKRDLLRRRNARLRSLPQSSAFTCSRFYVVARLCRMSDKDCPRHHANPRLSPLHYWKLCKKRRVPWS
jgi:hypothetical protein